MRHYRPHNSSRLVLVSWLLVCLAPDAMNTSQDGDDAVLRCYCNEVACVRTGYMCKTSLGACFAQRDDGHIRYACAHRLDDDSDRRLCLASAAASHDHEADYVIRRRVTSSSSRAEAVAWTELACCSTDMCNYYYFRSQREVVAADVHTTNVSRDPEQQLQQQTDEISSASSSSCSSSYLCLHTVVMVTVPLCGVVLLTLAAVATLYALGARRRRLTSPPAAAAAASLPLPVATECRCGGGDADPRHSWLARCSGCRQLQLPLTVTDDHCCKSVQHRSQQQHRQRHSADDGRCPAVVAPASPSLDDDRSLKPPSDHSESALLLVCRDA